MGVVMDTRIAPASNILKSELRKVFPSLSSQQVNVIFTFQNSKSDPLDFFSPHEDQNMYKKEFFEFSRRLGGRLNGYWWDFIDPSSGYPVREAHAESFSNTDACQRLLGLLERDTSDKGFVKHPLYGTEVFVSSFITDASEEVIQEKLREINDNK